MLYVYNHLDRVTPAQAETWIQQLPVWRRNSVLKKKAFNDRVGAVCSFRLLCHGLGYIPEEFWYNEYGKPFMKNTLMHFNISHSNNAAAVVISREMCGCDIESVRQYPPNVMKRMFSQNEQDYVANANDKETAFFQLWTLKESYVKALGISLMEGAKRAEFDVSGRDILCTDKKFVFSSYRLGNSIASVCGSKKIELTELDSL